MVFERRFLLLQCTHEDQCYIEIRCVANTISGKFFSLESELLVISCGPSSLFASFDDL